MWRSSLISLSVRLASIWLSNALPIFLMATSSPFSELTAALQIGKTKLLLQYNHIYSSSQTITFLGRRDPFPPHILMPKTQHPAPNLRDVSRTHKRPREFSNKNSNSDSLLISKPTRITREGRGGRGKRTRQCRRRPGRWGGWEGRTWRRPRRSSRTRCTARSGPRASPSPWSARRRRRPRRRRRNPWPPPLAGRTRWRGRGGGVGFGSWSPRLVVDGSRRRRRRRRTMVGEASPSFWLGRRPRNGDRSEAEAATDGVAALRERDAGAGQSKGDHTQTQPGLQFRFFYLCWGVKISLKISDFFGTIFSSEF